MTRLEMRILQVVQSPQRRGAEVFADLLSRELRRGGQGVRTVYLYPHAAADSLRSQPEELILDGDPRHRFEKVPGLHPGLLRRLRRAIADYRPEIVQLNGARTVKYGAFCASGLPAGCKLVYRNIGSPKRWVRGRLRRAFYRRLVMPRMDGIVAVSRSTLAELEELYRLSAPTVVIPNGVAAAAEARASRAEVRASVDTPPETPVLLYVGSLSADKRLDRWLRVARAVHDELPEVTLWLVGEGPERQRVEELAASLGLGNALRLLGSQQDVTGFLHAADLLLLTSDSEGMPAAVLEAGMHGLPVVAFRVGGLTECVADGETGLLVDAGAEEDAADAALGLLQDLESRSRMGGAARSWCLGRFSIEAVARRYLEFYRRLRATEAAEDGTAARAR